MAQDPQQTALVIIINSAIVRLCGVNMFSPFENVCGNDEKTQPFISA
jgi:hypothetical protein